MAFCASCGADTSAGRFCPACGLPVQAATAPSAGPAGAPATSSDLPENVASLLCYAVWALTGVVFLALEPYNRSKLVRFHAWQSIFASVAIFAGWFVILVAASILRMIPWIGVPVALIIVNVYGLIVLALWLLLMYKAYQGGSLELPFISKFANKQA